MRALLSRKALVDAAAIALDSAVFSNTAADATRPAGILAGVIPIGATAGGGQAALLGDLAALFGALGDANLGTNVMLFASPRRAIAAGVLSNQPIEIIPTPSLGSSVVAVDVGAFATGFSGAPDISTSGQATLHMEDTTPLAISTTGAPNSVAAPARSLWQTNCIGLRLLQRLAWAPLVPGAVQVINGVTW